MHDFPGHQVLDGTEDFTDTTGLSDIPDFGDETELDDVPPDGGTELGGTDHIVGGEPPAAESGKITGPARRGRALLEVVFHILDLIDRPFARVGYATRILVGWAALVTLFAAVCVLVFNALG